MSYATAEHDRMIAAMLIPCYVVAVDLAASASHSRSVIWLKPKRNA